MCFCLFSSLLLRREASRPLHVAWKQDQSHAWEYPEHVAGRVRWQAALLPGNICSICARNPNIKDSFHWSSGRLCSPELPLKSIQQLAEVTPLISVSYHSSRTDQPDMWSSSKALTEARVRTWRDTESSSWWGRVGKGIYGWLYHSREVITRTTVTILSDRSVPGTLLPYLI